MRSRIFFALVCVFWAVMSVLLWRSQADAHSRLGSAIPVEIVWEKILTSPDNSWLDIYDQDKKIGTCQWTANLTSAAEALNRSLADDYQPEGATPQPTGYGLNLWLNSRIFVTNHLELDARLHFSTNKTWQDLHMVTKIRPFALDLSASAQARKVRVKMNEGGGGWDRTLSFAQLENPESLLQELGGLGGLGLAGLAGFAPAANSPTQLASALHWEAHEDWTSLGHSKVRVYRLETQFLGHSFRAYISRAGEILLVDAPGHITLRNQAFARF